MKKIKKILTVSIAIVILSLLVITVGGCGKGSKGPATLKVIWWGSQTRHEKTLKVIEMYQTLNPEIKIEPTYTSWDGYWEKLSTLAAGGEMPDVINMTINQMPQYLEKNLLADLTNIATINKEAIDPAVLDSGKMDGKLLGICLGSNAMTLGYNKELFDKAGVAYPNEKWTWDDLEKASNALYSKLKVWGIGNISDSDVDFFIRSRGESMYTPDSKSVGFTEKTAVDFMTLINRLHKSQAMEPRKVAIETASNEENSSFAKQKCAMRFLWSNKIVSVAKTLGKTVELSVFPGPGSEQAMYIRPGMFFCISKTSKQKDKAGAFINWFVTDIEANKVLEADRGVPVVDAVRVALAANLDEQNKKIYDFIGFVGKFSQRPIDTQFPPTERECRRIISDLMEQVYYEKMTPEEAGKKWIEDWKVTLSR